MLVKCLDKESRRLWSDGKGAPWEHDLTTADRILGVVVGIIRREK